MTLMAPLVIVGEFQGQGDVNDRLVEADVDRFPEKRTGIATRKLRE